MLRGKIDTFDQCEDIAVNVGNHTHALPVPGVEIVSGNDLADLLRPLALVQKLIWGAITLSTIPWGLMQHPDDEAWW